MKGRLEMNLKTNKSTPIEETVECIEALAKIVKENDLGKIKIKSEDLDITIEGKGCMPPRSFGGMPPIMPPVQQVGMTAPASDALHTQSDASETVSGNIITSPIVGTFYSAPSPEKPAFVKLGDTVNEGDVVCIIESMKLMNELQSKFSGRVAEIYVNNGDAVEFGQKIMRIE